MTQPINVNYLNEVTARPAAALEAAGAWDPTPRTPQCSDFDKLVLMITYTQGAAGGACDIRVDVSDALTGTDWYSLTASNQAALVTGVDTQTQYQANYWTFDPVTANAEQVVLGPFELSGLMERFRVVCRESGAVGFPGTLAVEARLT